MKKGIDVDRIKVGIVGCGDISRRYFNMLCGVYANTLAVVVADEDVRFHRLGQAYTRGRARRNPAVNRQ